MNQIPTHEYTFIDIMNTDIDDETREKYRKFFEQHQCPMTVILEYNQPPFGKVSVIIKKVNHGQLADIID